MRHVVLRLGDLAVRKSYWARSLGARSTQGRHLHLSPPTMAKVTKNDEGKEVVLSGMTGSQCHLIFQPQGKKSTTVNAGTSVSCVDVNGEDKVTCREL